MPASPKTDSYFSRTAKLFKSFKLLKSSHIGKVTGENASLCPECRQS